MRINSRELNLLKKTTKKKNKYGAVKCVHDGIKFDSKVEGDYYLYLKDLEKAGLLRVLEIQPKVYLTDAKILYIPDFLIQNSLDIEPYYVDVKGVETPVFKLKKKLWKFYEKSELRLVRRKAGKFVISERVHAK